ncbi:MCM2/3/5 family protein [Gregarina niphandrodes]|uniref:DNA replication licensing factor MCM6 n=1 Tax=Gregarina niphandrodes TaxID=110365 RepID=A0A023B695_GRENI|nr:MCM2/3/5 family protein [Gregarina niphandrodes]EZG64342.1 MCM2/3/5 family protein [Gregarina niphandrodes]|eukprot:XP_011130642.1 MCM2/3/5 family protein [Gregarina niphandrodes]
MSWFERELWEGTSILKNRVCVDLNVFGEYVESRRLAVHVARWRAANGESTMVPPLPGSSCFNSAAEFLELFFLRLESLLESTLRRGAARFLERVQAVLGPAAREASGFSEEQVSGWLPRVARLETLVGAAETLYLAPRRPKVGRSVRELRAEDVGRCLSVRGVVTRITEVKPEVREGVFTCETCHAEIAGVRQEYRFTEPAQCTRTGCHNKSKWRFVKEKSRFEDWQRLKVQEGGAEQTPAGTVPRSVDVVVRGPVCDRCKPGDFIEVVGCVVAVPDVGSLLSAKEQPAEIRREKARALNSENQEPGITGLAKLGVKDVSYKLHLIGADVQLAQGAPEQDQLARDLATQASHVILELFSLPGAAAVPGEAVGVGPGDRRLQELLESPLARLFGITAEQHRRFKALAGHFDYLDRLSRHVAPELWGLTEVKKGVLCMLAGGLEKRSPQDGTKFRGDINVLVVGDPGTAKSRLLKFVQSVADRAVYASGKSSTAAGLTASVHKDPEVGESVVEAGALILADTGVCCIDEFDQMDVKDMVAIHEAMEQQTISISKAGIQATMNARASVLAACAPVEGRYKVGATLQANVGLAPTILSRFDLLFVVTEDVAEDTHLRLAAHRLRRRQGEQAATDGDDLMGFKELQTYLRVARHFRPRLTQEARQIIIRQYVNERQRAKNVRERNRSDSRATTRMLESVLRVSEAVAKLGFSHTVEAFHANLAIKLMNAQRKRRVDPVDLDEPVTDDEGNDQPLRFQVNPDEFDLMQTIFVSRLREQERQRELGGTQCDAGTGVTEQAAQTALIQSHSRNALIDWFVQTKAGGAESKKLLVKKVIARMINLGVLFEEEPQPGMRILRVHPNFDGVASISRTNKKTPSAHLSVSTEKIDVSSLAQDSSVSATNQMVEETFIQSLYSQAF